MSTTLASIAFPNLKGMSPELEKRVEECLLNSVVHTVIEALPDDKLDEFEKLLKKRDEVALRAFVDRHAPSAGPLISAVVEKARASVDHSLFVPL